MPNYEVPKLILFVLMLERCGDGNPMVETERVSSLKRQYETLLTSILSDHKTYLAQIRCQRDSTASNLETLLSRCEKLELALVETTRESIKEKENKQALQVRVEEMQTNIEQRIQDLRKRLDSSGRPSVDKSPELRRLKHENQQLRANITEFKVALSQYILTTGSTSSPVICCTRSNSKTRTRSPPSQTTVRPPSSWQSANLSDHELALHCNPSFQDRIKQIERLALRYAPLQGPEVDFLFSEIEYAKDVIDGTIPPPAQSKRTKSKHKKKIPSQPDPKSLTDYL